MYLSDNKKRPIRSFVKREGRFSPGQRHALETLWPSYGLAVEDKLIDPSQIFGRTVPLILEIGFGMGQSLLAMARQNPLQDYIGIEVYKPGIGHLLSALYSQQINNIRLYQADAVTVLQDCIPNACLTGIQIYFPDPWPKKRHHKRRLIQEPFIMLLRDKLKPSGYIHLATDIQDYAEQMLQGLTVVSGLQNQANDGRFIPRPEHRPLTKFEQRGIRLGHAVWDLIFVRS